MELYKRIVEIVDANLIYCLIPIILTLMLVKLIFKNRFETNEALNLIRWTIIVYAIMTWTVTLIGLRLYSDESVFINRVTGPYKVSYWIMLISSLILPFTLLIKKLGGKFWFVLLVAFCIKIGAYFERFVIIATNTQSVYLAEKGNDELVNSFYYGTGMIFLQGIIIAILTLGILEITKRKETVHNNL